MTRYIYHVSVHNQDALCPDVHTVTAFINNTMGCEFVTLDMVYNYFIRPRLSNKRIFGAEALIKLSRERARPATATRTSCMRPGSYLDDMHASR